MNALDNSRMSQNESHRPGKALSELLAGMASLDTSLDCKVLAPQLDSRQVKPGDLFIAIPGASVDGRDYLEVALNKGAGAVIYEALENPYEDGDRAQYQLDVDIERNRPILAIEDLRSKVSEIAARFYDGPSSKLKVVGVTGTNGKTTFSYLLAQACQNLGYSSAMMGTIGNGAVSSLTKSTLTTADAISVQRTLSEFVDKGMEVVCMEVSSHGLSQDRVSSIHFDTVVFTNLSQDHLDYHGDLKRYGEEKSKLFAFDDLQLAVINCEDTLGQQLIKNHRAKRYLTYGLSQGDIRPERLIIDESGIRFVLHWQGESVAISSSLLGEVNVANLLAVAACLLGMGVALDRLPEVFEDFVAPPGRMELFTANDDTDNTLPKVVVDYAHTPDALERALQSLRQISDQELVVVFGCGGDRDRGKRPIMGRIAEQYADQVIVTDDNPRNEPPEKIVADIVAGMSARPLIVHDREHAITEAICPTLGVRKARIVLIAGKGHEDSQTSKNGVIHLSDREIVMKVLEGQG